MVRYRNCAVNCSHFFFPAALPFLFVLRSGWIHEHRGISNQTKEHDCSCVCPVFKTVFFSPPQVVQGEAEVVITEMTAGIGILEGGILAVLGTEIMVEGLTTDQIKHLAQIRRMEAMGPITAAMVSAGAATMVMDSPTLATAKQEPLEPRTTSRPNSLLPVSLAHRLALVTPLSPSPRHRLHSSILLRWCPTPCLLSSLSKRTTYLKEVIYCFLSCFKFYR